MFLKWRCHILHKGSQIFLLMYFNERNPVTTLPWSTTRLTREHIQVSCFWKYKVYGNVGEKLWPNTLLYLVLQCTKSNVVLDSFIPLYYWTTKSCILGSLSRPTIRSASVGLRGSCQGFAWMFLRVSSGRRIKDSCDISSIDPGKYSGINGSVDPTGCELKTFIRVHKIV